MQYRGFSFPVFTSKCSYDICYPLYEGKFFMHFFFSWISYSTISLRHKIIPIVGSEFSGTSDPVFQWALLPENSFEGAFLSSPGIREDILILKTVGAIYQLGNIDCGMAAVHDTRYQRPALMKLRNYDKNYSSI